MKKTLSVFAVALLARLLYFAFFPARSMAVDDAVSWDTVAMNVAQGAGFVEDGHPTSVRPPMYLLFLAAIYKSCGHTITVVRLVQIFLSALTAVFIFWTARIFFHENLAVCAGLAVGLYPPLIIYSAILGSETLFIFFLACFMFVFVRAFQESSFELFLASGIVLGVTNLCRSTLALYPFFLLALLFLLKQGGRIAVKILLTAGVALAVMMPWTIRNYFAFGGFMLVNVSSGQLFWTGTILKNKGRYVEDRARPEYRQFDPYLGDPIRWEKEMFAAGLRNIRQSPLGYAGITLYKAGLFLFEPVGYTLTKQKSTFLAGVLLAGHGLLILFAFYGIGKTFGSNLPFVPLYALFLYFAVMHSIFAPMPRFRLPTEPFLIPFALSAIEQIQSKVHPKRT